VSLYVFWFGMLGVLLTGYAVLDGFDLGVGVLHLFARDDKERRVLLNSIGPLWDGNEVWLVTFGGALFAAFPRAYATVLSGFYLPVVTLLACLIGRAISIEFRSKRKERAWRTYWDVSFFASSTLGVFVMGVMAGHVVRGIPLDVDGEYAGKMSDLLEPYPLLVGLLAVATSAMHGAVYLGLKTEGDLAVRVRGWMWRSFFVFVALYAIVSIYTLTTIPHVLVGFRRYPLAWVVVVLNVLAVANVPRAIHHGKPGWAFISTGSLVCALTFLLAMAIFPNLVFDPWHPERSLSITEAASSESTLRLMRIIALLGLPFISTYTFIVYWVFRGKTKIDTFSY
jgi:cytochrome d ubiquinol oxidase subunit II